MSYKLRDKEVDIPEIDHFLKDYKALCWAHGMQLEKDDFSDCPSEYMTLKRFDPDSKVYLNLDNADEEIPCISLAIEAIESERTADAIKAQAARETWLKDPANKPMLLREGIWLEGQHYKLVPAES